VSYFPQGATSPTLPGGSSSTPWGSYDKWIYLAATVNRFIAAGKLSWTLPMPLKGAELSSVKGFPWVIYGPSDALARAAFTLYQQRVEQGEYAPEIATLKNKGADIDEVVRYVYTHVAPITASLQAWADNQGLPPAQGVSTSPGLPIVPLVVIGGAILLVTRKKGRR
jgi:hypothetical protein